MNSSLSTTITVSFPHSLSVPPLYHTAHLSSSTMSPSSSWSSFLYALPNDAPGNPHPPRPPPPRHTPTSPLPSAFYNPTPKHIHKLLTVIWKVSGITRTILIRTSWYILAKTCMYGNSITMQEGERNSEKGHTEGSRV